MEKTFNIVQVGDQYQVVINGTRKFILDSLDDVLKLVSETLLEEEDTNPTF